MLYLFGINKSSLSPSPFVFCVIYGYCMTFGEIGSPYLCFEELFPYSEMLVTYLQSAVSFQFKI